METKDLTEELIVAFHRTWDAFPGIARLIDRQHRILASNPMAEKAGFIVGAMCAKIGEPASHKGCKMRKMFGNWSVAPRLPFKNFRKMTIYR